MKKNYFFDQGKENLRFDQKLSGVKISVLGVIITFIQCIIQYTAACYLFICGLNECSVWGKHTLVRHASVAEGSQQHLQSI